jgi:hypothetical protein
MSPGRTAYGPGAAGPGLCAWPNALPGATMAGAAGAAASLNACGIGAPLKGVPAPDTGDAAAKRPEPAMSLLNAAVASPRSGCGAGNAAL